MKRYREKSKYVEACQFNRSLKSIIELKDFVGNDLIYWDNDGVFFDNTKIEKGWWIVRNIEELVEYHDFVLMRDDQFKEAYEE